MNEYSEVYRSYYPKVFLASIAFIVMAGYLIGRSDKPRGEFLHKSGTVTYLSHTNPFQEERGPSPKDYFLAIDSYERVFEMFVGTDEGDFSPRVNLLEKLGVGDKIDIYFEEDSQTEDEQINRLLQYLDKNGELLYLRSKADKYIGYFILGCSGLLIVAAFYMKAKSN